jgi:hypothetical protein
MAVQRDHDHQIFRPRRQVPKFTDSLHGKARVSSRLDLHLIGQTGKGDVKRGNVFGSVAHEGLLAVSLQMLGEGLVRIISSKMPSGAFGQAQI